MVKLVGHHSCGADRLPVAVRFPTGPRESLKTVDPPKGNGLGQKKTIMASLLPTRQQMRPIEENSLEELPSSFPVHFACYRVNKEVAAQVQTRRDQFLVISVYCHPQTVRTDCEAIAQWLHTHCGR